MPESKKRKHDHQFNQPHRGEKKKTGKTFLILTIFFALMGTGIAYFGAGNNIMWLITGAILGGVAGYMLAMQIDKAAYPGRK
jgi:hypothetical protein